MLKLRAANPFETPSLFVDATGVAMPIVGSLTHDLEGTCRITAVTLAGTDHIKKDFDGRIPHWRVGKARLVSRLQALLNTQRIRLPQTAQAKALAKELEDYEIRIDERTVYAHFGAFKTGSHDDLVTALGLAALEDRWTSQRSHDHLQPRERTITSDLFTVGF